MDSLFFNIFQFFEKRKGLFATVLILLFVLLSWLSSSIKFEEDISKLIPSNSENETLQRVLKTANFSDKILVNLSLNNAGEFSDLVIFADAFCDSITTHHSNLIRTIQGKIDDDDALLTIDFVYNNLPLFLTSENYKAIHNKINKDSIQAITQSNYKTIVSPTGFIAKTMITKDPFGLSFIGLKQLNDLARTDNFIIKDGYLTSKDEKHILLFLTPNKNLNDNELNEQLSNTLYSLKDKLLTSYSEDVQANFFGGPLIAAANAKQIKTDIQLTVGVALSVLFLIFIIFYKKITIPIILFIPTVFGAVLAITLLSCIRSEISAISLGIGAVLLGVTLDYSLHILTHIRNGETVKAIYKSITKPILMSSITTALAFSCLLLIESQALQDLGIFAAISVLGASVFALIFIPQVYKTQRHNTNNKATYIDAFASYNFSTSKIAFGCIIILVVLSAFTFNKVEFNNNLSQLNYISDELEDSENKINALTNISSKSLYVVAYGSEIENLLQTNDSVFNTLNNLKKEGMILDFNSVGALVKSKARQNEHIKLWKNFWSEQRQIQTKLQLIESGNTFGFKSSSFNQFYELLNTDFRILDINDYSNLSTFPISDFISTEGDFKTVHSVIKVDDNQIANLIHRLNDMNDVLIIDRQHVNEELLGHLRSDFNQLVRYSLLLIFVLLLLFYRDIKLTVVTILPIVITWWLTLGIMGLFSLEFNIFNIIISTFIFGLGVDYSIFMTNGLKQQNGNSISNIATYKTSIILSVITTVLGVGVLIFAKHPALYSLALVSIIGIVSALFITFTFQPFLFKFFIKKPINERQHGEN